MPNSINTPPLGDSKLTMEQVYQPVGLIAVSGPVWLVRFKRADGRTFEEFVAGSDDRNQVEAVIHAQFPNAVIEGAAMMPERGAVHAIHHAD